MTQSNTSNVICTDCGHRNQLGATSCAHCGIAFARYIPYPESETKRCPYCAEEIKVDAVICRFCTFDLQTGRPTASAQSPRDVKARSGVMDGVKLGFGMFIVLPLIILACALIVLILMAVLASLNK